MPNDCLRSRSFFYYFTELRSRSFFLLFYRAVVLNKHRTLNAPRVSYNLLVLYVNVFNLLSNSMKIGIHVGRLMC